ncbi:MAG: iron-containing alcohol dehydrogenase [Treponema sp.]|jgi:alcohol dehydrogenase YqhD (iron-dependent ADH family)|nr:iron-containing alcohol dehydrogenase [Treponema sp.]
MNDFSYFTPTKVVFGKKTETETGKLVKAFGGTRVLVHFGGKSAQKTGLLDRVCKSLAQSGIFYVKLGGVVPNPRLSLVRTGIELCKKEKIDFILAVGGGSVIDSGKAIAYGAATAGDVWDIYLKKTEPTACLPIGTVLTIAAAGSEMSDSSVITNEEGMIKRGYSNDLCRCRFAVMNPELTETLPDYQTMCGCTDIIMHTLERWFGKDGTYSELTDSLAEGLLKTVMHNACILKENPLDYTARAEIMWAGSLSHNGLTGCGNGAGDWATHQMGHEITSLFGTPHGASLAAVWASWARYVYKEHEDRFAKLAEDVMGILPEHDETLEETALEGISAMEEFFREIGMPTTLHEISADMADTQIQELAEKCTFRQTRTIGQFKTLNFEDIKKIYKAAY